LSNALFACALALVAVCVSAWLRRPALAHALWVLVFVKLITPPLIEIPLWERPISDRYEDVAGPAGKGSPASLEEREGTASVSSKSPEHPAPSTGEIPAGGRERLALFSGLRLLPWRQVVAWVAFAGSVVWFARTGRQVSRFRRLLRYATPASAELTDEVRACADRFGLARCPQVLLIPGIMAPVVWALGRRARLLLPRDLLARLSPTLRGKLRPPNPREPCCSSRSSAFGW